MSQENRSSANKRAIELFAQSFYPPLQIVRTDRIGGTPVANGWTCSHFDAELEMGVTAICWGGGHFKAYLEKTGTREDAERSAACFADVFRFAQEDGAPEGDDARAEWSGQPTPYAVEAGFSHQVPAAPNPDLIDMSQLSPSLRLALTEHFPELRFAIRANGERYRVIDGILFADERAGYATAEQINAALADSALMAGNGADFLDSRSRVAKSAELGRRAAEATGGSLGREDVSRPAARPRAAASALNEAVTGQCDHEWSVTWGKGGVACRKCGAVESLPGRRQEVEARNAQRANDAKMVDEEEAQRWRDAQDRESKRLARAARKMGAELNRLQEDLASGD